MKTELTQKQRQEITERLANVEVLGTTEPRDYYITGGHFDLEKCTEVMANYFGDVIIGITSCREIYYHKEFLPDDVLFDLEEKGPRNGWHEVPASRKGNRGVKPAMHVTIIFRREIA